MYVLYLGLCSVAGLHVWLVRRLQITCLFQLVPESPQMTVLNFVLGGGQYSLRGDIIHR